MLRLLQTAFLGVLVSKFFRGSMPPDPPRRLAPSTLVMKSLYRNCRTNASKLASPLSMKRLLACPTLLLSSCRCLSVCKTTKRNQIIVEIFHLITSSKISFYICFVLIKILMFLYDKMRCIKQFPERTRMAVK